MGGERTGKGVIMPSGNGHRDPTVFYRGCGSLADFPEPISPEQEVSQCSECGCDIWTRNEPPARAIEGDTTVIFCMGCYPLPHKFSPGQGVRVKEEYH